MSVAAVLLLSFLLLLVIGVPIYIALGLSSLITIIAFDLVPLELLPSQLFSSFNSFTLLAIPFFILAGNILARSEISTRLIDLAKAIVGRLRGGLAVVSVLVGVFFAGISGSGPADVGAQGKVLIPAMVRDGYPRAFSSALIAANSAIGIVVPPSIALIIYGVVADVSIGRLFIAGIIPGLVVGLSLAVLSLVLARRNHWGNRGGRPEPSEPDAAACEAGPAGELRADTVDPGRTLRVLRALRRATLGLLAPLIILGGIYSGVFTPTEAAAVVVVYALVVSMLVYRDVRPRHLPSMLSDTARTTGVVMIIIGCASIFAFLLNTQGIAQLAGGWLADTFTHPVAALLTINLVLLLAGTLLDAISIYYIFVPILLPVALGLGVDPVHFGIIATVNLAIGQVTPPVGVNLYVACAVGGVSLERISRAVLPIVAAQLVALALVTFIPELSLWLPDLLGV